VASILPTFIVYKIECDESSAPLSIPAKFREDVFQKKEKGKYSGCLPFFWCAPPRRRIAALPHRRVADWRDLGSRPVSAAPPKSWGGLLSAVGRIVDTHGMHGRTSIFAPALAQL